MPDSAAETPAPGPIEEIVVTGELRPTALADSAASISVISLDEQRAGTVNHLEEVLGWVPNVNLSSGGSRARFVQIRGIGERGQFAEPLNPSVGLVLDGVDMSGIGTAATLFDVAQVEVLRGPQGTVYGANALGGLINVRSNAPSDSFSARLRLDGGSYDSAGLGGVLSGPLTENLGARLAVQRYRDDGFMRNRYLRRDDTSNHDELTARGRLSWAPSDSSMLDLMLGYVDADNGYDAFSLDNDRNTLSDQPGRDAQQSRFGSLRLGWDMNEAVTFQGTLGLAASDIDYGYDEDWTYPGFDPDGYASTDAYLRNRDTASLDLRWLSGDAGRLFADSTDWLVGVYALRQQVDLTRRYTFFPADFTSSYDVDRVALYGELTSRVSTGVRVTLGLRGERHEARYRDSEALRFRPRDDMLGGRLVVQADLSDHLMSYFSLTRGYKAGGFNISGSLDADLREYDPEHLWNAELGWKGSWLDGALDVRAALFYMRRDDVQVDTSIVRLRSDGSAEFIDLIGNAADGSNRGAELEIDYRPLEALTLFANVGLLDTEYRKFVNQAGEDLSGEEQAHAPHYQFYAGVELRPAPRWYARVESEGRDSFYFSNSPRYVSNAGDLHSNAYVLWHASIGYEAPRWSLKLWGRNLSDHDYAQRGFYFGNDPRDGYTARGFYQLGEPRRYGATLTWWY
ncbi:MAG: TonB-dependent receptor [Pseudomonadales bacterium]